MSKGHITKLPTGKEFYAHANIIGIDEEDNIYGGYDQKILDADAMEFYDTWPEADCIALANLMIARWTKFRERFS